MGNIARAKGWYDLGRELYPNEGSAVRRLWEPHNANRISKMVLSTVNLGPPGLISDSVVDGTWYRTPSFTDNLLPVRTDHPRHSRSLS